MENQKITPESAAETIAQIVVSAANSDTEVIFKTVSSDEQFPVDKNRFGSVFFELVFFYIHLTDRLAYQYLEHTKRIKFLDIFLTPMMVAMAMPMPTTGRRFRSLDRLSTFHTSQMSSVFG